MRALIVTAVSACCLLGCATPEEKAAKQRAEMERMIVEFGPACTRLGFAVNTDPWRRCVVQLAERDGVRRGVSTSLFGGFGSGGRGGLGIGINIGR